MRSHETLNSDEPNVSDKVEILSTEDEKLKAIGEILSSDSSRKILRLLFNQSLTANEIAQKTELSLPLVIHHLKKMQSVQVVKITNIGKNTKSHDMKYYTIDKFAIVVMPSEMTKSARKSKSLFNSFSRIHRLATLGGAAVAAWFSTQFLQSSKTITMENTEMVNQDAGELIAESAPAARSLPLEELPAAQPVGDPSLDILWSVIAVLGVIVTGLSIEVIIKQKRQK